MATPDLSPLSVASFHSRYTRRDPDDCWEWHGYRQPSGYGRFGSGRHRTRMMAHRFALILSGRYPTEDRSFALHSCDNPACVNPSHLRWGSAAENTADMMARGRHNPPKNRCGSGNPYARLTEDLVRQILRDRRPQSQIAADFGVAQGTISHIKSNRSWRHVRRDSDNAS